MISNERPSPYGHHKPYGSPTPPVNEDTLRAETIQIERKTFQFTLKENPRGRFLRITEDVYAISALSRSNRKHAPQLATTQHSDRGTRRDNMFLQRHEPKISVFRKPQRQMALESAPACMLLRRALSVPVLRSPRDFRGPRGSGSEILHLSGTSPSSL